MPQNPQLLAAYMINALLLVLILGWPLLALAALLRLRRLALPGSTVTLWVIIILFIPVLGALAFFLLIHKGNGRQQHVE